MANIDDDEWMSERNFACSMKFDGLYVSHSKFCFRLDYIGINTWSIFMHIDAKGILIFVFPLKWPFGDHKTGHFFPPSITHHPSRAPTHHCADAGKTQNTLASSLNVIMADQANHSSASPAAKLSLVQTISSPITSGSPAWSLSFTPDAKYLAVCYGCPNTCVKIWRRVTRQCTSNKDPIDPTTDANETFKIGNSGSNMKECWRPFATIEGHTRSIRDVEFAPISTSSTLILATASFDGMVMIWEGDVSQFDDMYDSTYNSDMGSDDDENKFEECTFEAIAQLEGHENEVKHVAWNQTGSLLASCGRDKTVWVWECFLPGTVGGMSSNDASMQDDGDFECLAVLQGHDGEFFSI